MNICIETILGFMNGSLVKDHAKAEDITIVIHYCPALYIHMYR